MFPYLAKGISQMWLREELWDGDIKLDCCGLTMWTQSNHILTGLTRKFFWFISQNKRYFLCSPRTWLNSIFIILFHYLLPFSANFIFPSYKNFYLFKQRTIPSVFYSLPGNLNFFPLREFSEDLNKWKAETSMSGKYSWWIRISQTVAVFAWPTKTY